MLNLVVQPPPRSPCASSDLTAQELDTNGKPNGLVLSETIFLAPSDSSSGSCNRMMMAKRAPHPPQFVSPSMDDTLTYGSDGKVELNVDYVDGVSVRKFFNASRESNCHLEADCALFSGIRRNPRMLPTSDSR